MKLNELVSAVSAETGIPAKEVKKITSAVLEKFAQLIDKQDKFGSSIVTIRSSTIPAKPAKGGKPALAERKVGRIQRRKPKAS